MLESRAVPFDGAIEEVWESCSQIWRFLATNLISPHVCSRADSCRSVVWRCGLKVELFRRPIHGISYGGLVVNLHLLYLLSGRLEGRAAAFDVIPRGNRMLL